MTSGTGPEGFGARMRRLRKEAHLTQAQVAEKLNLTPQAVSQYETERRRPDYESIDRFACIYGVTVRYLLTGQAEIGDLSTCDIAEGEFDPAAFGLPQAAKAELEAFIREMKRKYGKRR